MIALRISILIPFLFDVSPADVWNLMQRYGKEIRAASSVTVKLYPFMRQLQDKYECDTDDEVATANEECEATLSYSLEAESETYKDNTP